MIVTALLIPTSAFALDGIFNSMKVFGKTEAAVARLCKAADGEWDGTEDVCGFASGSIGVTYNDADRVDGHISTIRDGDGGTALNQVAILKGSVGPYDSKKQVGNCQVWSWLGVDGYNFHIGDCGSYSVTLQEKL